MKWLICLFEAQLCTKTAIHAAANHNKYCNTFDNFNTIYHNGMNFTKTNFAVITVRPALQIAWNSVRKGAEELYENAVNLTINLGGGCITVMRMPLSS